MFVLAKFEMNRISCSRKIIELIPVGGVLVVPGSSCISEHFMNRLQKEKKYYSLLRCGGNKLAKSRKQRKKHTFSEVSFFFSVVLAEPCFDSFRYIRLLFVKF